MRKNCWQPGDGNSAMKTIGVLALQGAVEKHLAKIKFSGNKGVAIRTNEELSQIDGLILPGGESSVMKKLLIQNNILNTLKSKIQSGLPVFGTCAGLILLAKRIENDQPTLEALNITVQRNGYGSQLESFEAPLTYHLKVLSEKKAIFIRAPVIKAVDPKVEILAKLDQTPVMVRQKHLLAATFHPELTENSAVHQYFIKEIC
ncbi:MAG: pyridoxal 5'-phosphate synthase glutaminase subunit PdxT [Spirochaetes bacterium]|nr:pyridoxal 5'-phosphate synthase glutaminase subunit PdxT [Spirochaetota bacterium]